MISFGFVESSNLYIPKITQPEPFGGIEPILQTQNVEATWQGKTYIKLLNNH